MKAQDLRIGNLVYYRDKSKVLTVDNLGSKGFSTIDENGLEYGSDDVSEYNGIELTEEWVLRMGFEKKSWFSQGIVIECVYYEMNGVIVYLIKSGFEIEIKHREDQFNLLRVWKYLHELQNIFKIFTGEELTIK